MLKFSERTIKTGLGIGDRAFSLLCFLGLFFSPVAIASVRTPDTSPFFLAKIYEGFQDEKDECDFTIPEGWFYWYIDSSGLCTTVMVANEEEAIRRSNEILEYSFDVVVSGYGANF
ncbi:MAG: hypothetical protein AAGA60_27930 [Cyanobacteria bacterium P01_E01_bin.42]